MAHLIPCLRSSPHELRPGIWRRAFILLITCPILACGGAGGGGSSGGTSGGGTAASSMASTSAGSSAGSSASGSGNSSAPASAPDPTPPVPVIPPPPPPADGTLSAAPVVRVFRDDRVATLEMDYNADKPANQFWNMSGSYDDDAGFLVTWWPQAGATAQRAQPMSGEALAQIMAGEGGMCLSPDSPLAAVLQQRDRIFLASNTAAQGKPSLAQRALNAMAAVGGGIIRSANAAPLNLPVGAKWLVTANRRIQLQPLDNNTAYTVRVQRLSARGKITSQASEVSFNGGDPTRVNALRASLTYFDDFNLPMGPADEKKWNNAQTVSTDPRFNLFFVNDQLHAHTIHGTLLENTGDRSQTSQRFRKKIRIEEGVRRRIVFDMDSPLSGRSVWYLDLNPVPTEVTGNASFFDEQGDIGLPAGVLRLRASGSSLSVNLIDMKGSLQNIAKVDLEEVGRQAVSNVRRAFDVRVGTTDIQVFVDGRSVINASFVPHKLPAADYEALWVDFGYNTPKDNVYYYLHHWDNFGFDGPVVDAREVHNYVTRIKGTDYQKATRDAPATFTVRIPDDLRPTASGVTAEAWLVFTQQMGDYSFVNIAASDFVRVNGNARLPMPPKPNNSQTPALSEGWGFPMTQRIKLGDLVKGGTSPLVVGDNSFQFNIQNSGVLNVHVEVLYPPGSAPAYTPPSSIHPFPLHAEVPRLGPPARLQNIGGTDVGFDQGKSTTNPTRIPVNGTVPLNIEVGNSSWAGWAPQWMRVPINSAEVFTTGGTAGIARIDVFLRKAGSGSGPGDLVLTLDTAIDAPAPQGRYLMSLDSRIFANGDYEIFVQATTPSGQKSHPSYGDETHHFDISQVSGAYYPIPIRIQN